MGGPTGGDFRRVSWGTGANPCSVHSSSLSLPAPCSGGSRKRFRDDLKRTHEVRRGLIWQSLEVFLQLDSIHRLRVSFDGDHRRPLTQPVAGLGGNR